LKSTLRSAPPNRCDDRELAEFERLVRAGFSGSDENLPLRIRSAHSLAFFYDDDLIAGIAGLKSPDPSRREECFQSAQADADASAFPLELGWVYVEPAYRGAGIGERLCRILLARAPANGVYATTRPDNRSMLRILGSLGFLRAGDGHARSRRDDALELHLLRATAGARA